MERQSALFTIAVALYVLSLLEVTPAFVSPIEGSLQRASNLRGSSGVAGDGPTSPEPLAWRSGLQAASTFLVLSACALASRTRAAATLRRAGVKEFEKGNPTLTFVSALENVAAKKEQSVAVTKDVMKAKRLFNDESFNDSLLYVVNANLTVLEQADGMLKLFGDMESEVFPKYVKYLAKKNRLHQLSLICKEYVAGLYKSQKIVPVLVTSAVALTDEQKQTMKEKLKEKTGAADIKLITATDGNLIAGFTAEWGFTDPETLSTPTEGVNLSLKSYLAKAKLKGIQ